MNDWSMPIHRRCTMHANSRCSAAAALHDHPPVDKPDRLPPRERWRAAGTARGGGAR